MSLMKKEIITITGKPGSGKSSTADLIAKELGYQRFSSGDFMRQIALETGISLNDLSKQAEADNGEIDKKIDDAVRNAGNQEKIVIDSRLAFHWIPESFKIYLDLPLEISKERILKNLEENKLRQASETAENAEDVYKKITKRLESERKRYKELYGIEDHTAHGNFDLVVNTNKNSLEQVAEIIIKEYKSWLSK